MKINVGTMIQCHTITKSTFIQRWVKQINTLAETHSCIIKLIALRPQYFNRDTKNSRICFVFALSVYEGGVCWLYFVM